MSEDEQMLKDPQVKPTDKIIAKCLGITSGVYNQFLEELNQYNISLMDWRYYNDGKTWLSKGEYHWITTRGTHKVKPIFWVSIWNNFFKISFNFSEKIRDQLLSLPLSDKTKQLIKNTEPNGTKMKFISVIFDVTSNTQFHDIFLLAQFRKENI